MRIDDSISGWEFSNASDDSFKIFLKDITKFQKIKLSRLRVSCELLLVKERCDKYDIVFGKRVLGFCTDEHVAATRPSRAANKTNDRFYLFNSGMLLNLHAISDRFESSMLL